MKKILAMILALVMVFSLCACGGGDASNSPAPSQNPGTVDPGNADPAPEGGYNGESFTIAMASSNNGVDDQSRPMKYFQEKVAELSGGKVNVTISWGGTEYDDAGIWEAMGSGLLNMDFMLLNKQTGNAPMMSWGFMPYGASAQESMNQTNWLIFENEETAKIMSDYMGAAGMTILGNCCDGAPSFITTFPWETLDELVAKCTSFGTMNTAKYQSLGLSCTSVRGRDAYENLDRGIIDGNSSSLSSALSNSLNEVAGYACVDGQITAGVLIVANEDWWNDLSDEARAMLTQAIDETEAFCVQHVDEATAAAATAWEEKTGNKVRFLEGDDAVNFWVNTLLAIANNAKQNAAGKAYEENMKTILNTWIAYQAEYHGVTIDWAW